MFTFIFTFDNLGNGGPGVQLSITSVKFKVSFSEIYEQPNSK